MRPSIMLASFASLAALVALTVAGCKYSTVGSPLPGPSPAPTLGPGIVSEAKIPTAAATPLGITSGPDGNLWFTEFNGNKIGKAVPNSFPAAGSIVECGPLPSANSGPVDIVSDASTPNKVWFDEFASDRIGNVDTSTCTYNEFAIPTANAGPEGLTADQNGVLWFAESATGIGAVAKMTIGGTVTEYATGLQGSNPISVAIAGDNTVWYVDGGRNSVGHLTFPGGVPTFVDYGIPTNPADPFEITLGPDGALWFTELGINTVGCQIGRITTGASPTVSEFTLPFLQNPPDGDLCLDLTSAGGAIWFAEADSGAIGRVTTGGVVTEFGIPGNGTTAVFVANGPDGNLWFTDGAFDSSVQGVGTNQIGRVKIGMIPALSTIRTFKAKVSTHRLRLLNANGSPIFRINGRPINP
jgi:streptogramin lyase